ncbi:MAG: hypothetical protein R2867_08570 [Caldilineaceae bacterium]
MYWDSRDAIYVMANAALKQQHFAQAEALYQGAGPSMNNISVRYIGWGSTCYGQALTQAGENGYGSVEAKLLDQAISTYETALGSEMDRPPLAFVEEKINFARGQALFLRALVKLNNGESESAQGDLLCAITDFQAVITAYEAQRRGRTDPFERARCHAHGRIGLINRFATV